LRNVQTRVGKKARGGTGQVPHHEGLPKGGGKGGEWGKRVKRVCEKALNRGLRSGA